jgi:hypothetical protein
MEVEITIDRRKKLPEGAVHALEKEPLRRFPDILKDLLHPRFVTIHPTKHTQTISTGSANDQNN